MCDKDTLFYRKFDEIFQFIYDFTMRFIQKSAFGKLHLTKSLLQKFTLGLHTLFRNLLNICG